MKTARVQTVVVVAALPILLLAAAGAQTQAPTIESELGAVEARFQEAQRASWHFYAPKTFGEATEKLAEAKARFTKGGKIEDIRSRLQEAERKLAGAGEYADIGQVILQDALAARAAALEANAPDHAGAEWLRAKDSLESAGRAIESGNHNDARKKAGEAEDRFRKAELEAIRVDLLGEAHRVQEAAAAAGAAKKAPATFAEASTLLDQAERTLQGDRYQRARAAEQARAATRAFRHATLISTRVDRMEAKNPPAVEKLFLEHERAVAATAEALGLPVDFSGGLQPVAASVVDAVGSLKADRDNLRQELDDRAEQLGISEARADSLDLALAALGQREQSTVAAMQAERKRQRDLQSVNEIFSRDEGQVFVQGDELIIRLYGLSFPVGSAVIQPRNFALLTRLQRALRVYPDARVSIEGHTDAQGDADLNERLSLQRAEAVRAYLAANMPADAPRLEAAGFGETVPLASNETPEGRAMNRRIDVRLIGISGR
jgi:OOP family OmpA-OmpF porin